MKSINLSAIDLNLLVAFEALLEQQSVTKAAESMRIGQPAMSSALSRLRFLFEDELFVRFGRQMHPTLKAQAIAPSILSALHQIRQAVELSQTFDPLISDRDFAIGSSDYTSLVLLPSLLAFSDKNAPNINYRMIGFEKDGVGELLEKGAINVALGVFSDPPRQTLSEPLFTEHFVGIARQDHPALARGTMDLKSFAKFPHALFTLRRDAIGEVDRVLAENNLQRRIALTTPHLLVLPSAIAKSNLVATVPYRIALHLASFCNLSIFELPIKTKPWMVSMLWSTLSDRDEASCWLRQSIKTICQQIN